MFIYFILFAVTAIIFLSSTQRRPHRRAQHEAQHGPRIISHRQLRRRSPSPLPPDSFPTTKRQVYEVFFVLQHLMPTELAHAVLRYAEYGTAKTSRVYEDQTVHSNGSLMRGLYLLSDPISAFDVGHVFKIRFTVESKDQGWVGQPERGSWSWWQVGVVDKLIDEGEDAENNELNVQSAAFWNPRAGERDKVRRIRFLVKNELGGREFKRNEIEWSTAAADEAEAAWVQQLSAGDRIALVACAQYGAWSNEVQMGKIEVFSMDVR